MSNINDNVYRLMRPDNQAATAFTLGSTTKSSGAAVLLLPMDSANLGQRWKVEKMDHSGQKITMRDITFKQYIGYNGKPLQDKSIQQVDDVVEWRLVPTEEPDKYFIVVPEHHAGHHDGPQLALDVNRNSPPQLVIRQLHTKNIHQAWCFQLAMDD